MSDRVNFKKSVKSIAADGREETGKFIARLKALTPEEFLRLPRHDLERLTLAQYADVAAAILPGLDLRPARDKPDAPPKSERRNWSLGQLSIAAVAASVVVAFGVVLAEPIVGSFGGTAELVRPYYIGNWPRCIRLTESVDGCVYVSHQDLNWDYVAYRLKIDVAELRNLNNHLPSTYAPAHEKIIVWRGVGRLEN